MITRRKFMAALSSIPFIGAFITPLVELKASADENVPVKMVSVWKTSNGFLETKAEAQEVGETLIMSGFRKDTLYVQCSRCNGTKLDYCRGKLISCDRCHGIGAISLDSMKISQNLLYKQLPSGKWEIIHTRTCEDGVHREIEYRGGKRMA